MYPIWKVTENSHVKWYVKIVESRKLSQFSPRISPNANCSVVSESQYRIMHTDKSRQNAWALTSNTDVIEIQMFCLQRRCISLTEKCTSVANRTFGHSWHSLKACLGVGFWDRKTIRGKLEFSQAADIWAGHLATGQQKRTWECVLGTVRWRVRWYIALNP